MPISAHFETTASYGNDSTLEHDGSGGGQASREQTPRDARRLLRLEAEGTFAGGSAGSVLVHNLSRTGILLETGVALEAGEIIEIQLPEAGQTRARVVWTSDRLYGCAFEARLSDAALSASQLRGSIRLSPQGASEAATVAVPAIIPAMVPSALGGESLGERIYRLRKQKGLTQGELAALLNVSKPTVWAWEQGRAKPIEERMAAIAEALGVDGDELKPDRFAPGMSDVIARCRDQIATVVETTPDKVRIMIEL